MELLSTNRILGTGVVFLSMCLAVVNLVFGDPLPKRRKLEPRFLPTPTNITVHRGEVAVLRCHIYDLGPKMVVWRKKHTEVPLTIGDETFSQLDKMSLLVEQITDKESTWDLLIEDVQLSHAGTYLCQVTASKLYTHYITLNVLKEPVKAQPAVVLTGTQYVNKDNVIHLKCNATAASRTSGEIDWFFNGEPVVTSKQRWRDRARIVSQLTERYCVSDLYIERSKTTDQGYYVCRSADLDMRRMYVHVLSAEKDNTVEKRAGLSNYSQSSDSSKGAIFSMSPVTTLVHTTLVVIFIRYSTTCR